MLLTESISKEWDHDPSQYRGVDNVLGILHKVMDLTLYKEVHMDERYIRNIPALTEEECKLLLNKKIAVIGCGGLGGYIIELMTRIGIGSIRIVDGDVFDESNLNRQLLSEISLIGKGKAEAAGMRIAKINPDVKFEINTVFLNEENAADLISGCDVVMDALDNIKSRRILAKACEAAGTPYIFGAISGWVAQAAVSMPGDKLIEQLYPANTIISEKSALSFSPALCASMQTALCVKLLINRPVKTGTIHHFDLLDENFEFMSFEVLNEDRI